MSKKNGSKSAPAINAAPRTAESKAATITKIGEAEITVLAGAMLAALMVEGAAFAEADKAKEGAAGTCFNAIRASYRGALIAHGPDGANAVLDTFKARAMLEGDKYKARAATYASILNRAGKAMKANREVPEALWTASLSEWRDAEFWKAGKAASGRRPNPAKAKPEADEAGDVGAAAEAATKDKALSGLMVLVAALKGPFRKEFFAQASELASAILKRQHAASGGTR